MKNLSKELKQKGWVVVGSIKAPQYLSHIRQITNSLNEIPDSEIMKNYRLFLMRLEKFTKQKDNSAFSSSTIIQKFLSSDLKLFQGIEVTMQGILCAAIKVSVERNTFISHDS